MLVSGNFKTFFSYSLFFHTFYQLVIIHFLVGPILIEIHKNNTIYVMNVGDSIDLFCMLQGYPMPLDYPKWNKENSPIESINRRFNFNYTLYSLLHFNNLTKSHNGTYICKYNRTNSISINLRILSNYMNL